ncbi:diguanylate cyclase domain-containing protein [Pseudomonadota bacterium]
MPTIKILALSVLITVLVLAFDLSLPLGVAGGVPYVALVLVGLWYPRRDAAFALALIATVLTVAGYLFSAPKGIPWMVLTNRGLALFAIWVTAILVARHRKDVSNLDLAAAVFNNASGGIIITDASNTIIAVNPAFTNITGYEADEVIGNNPNFLQSGRHDADFYKAMWSSIQEQGSWQGEIWNRTKSGIIYPERLSLAVQKDRSGRIVNHIALFQDITVQKNAEAQLLKKTHILELLHATAENANTARTTEGALQTELDAICSYTGWPIGHVYLVDDENEHHLVPSMLWHLDDPEGGELFVETTQAVTFDMGDGMPGRILASGRHEWISDVSEDKSCIRSEVAKSIGLISALGVPVLVGNRVVGVMEFYSADMADPDHDLLQVLDNIGRQLGQVFERTHTERELRHLADHDALTGLPTTRLSIDRLRNAIAMARRSKSMAAVLFIDLDGFKAVNDTFGHEAGDELLKSVAERLRACVREVDTVARIGGDEFAIVLTNLEDVGGAERVAQSVIDHIAQPFTLKKDVAIIGASIGISIYPDNGDTPKDLLKRADEAMYSVKGKGKNDFAFATTQ